MREGLRRFLLAAALAAVCAVVLHPGPAGGAGRDGPERRQAECRTSVTGSTVTARCFNRGAYPDAVQLHIECARWWDPDVDGVRVVLGPAEGADLSDRCWFGVARAWISHQ